MRNRADEAIEHLRQAIALNPENRSLARQDPDLDALRDHEPFQRPHSTPLLPRIAAGRSAAAEVGLSAADAAATLAAVMSDIHVVVLAAGKGTRMKSALPKVLHAAGGLPLIDHVLAAAATLSPTSIVVVVGHQAEPLKEAIGKRPGLRFARAGASARHWPCAAAGRAAAAGARAERWCCFREMCRCCGRETLARSFDRTRRSAAAATVLTAIVGSPDGYGRIVRRTGQIAAIVEHKDAVAGRARDREINSGVYAFDLGAAVRRAARRSVRRTRRASTTCRTW